MPKSVFAVERMKNNKSVKCARVALPQCVVETCVI
jgi:hypothetical protein